MERKHIVWIGIFVGSTLGGLIPELWGAGIFSLSSILLSGVGAVAGIYGAYKLTEY